MIKILVIILFFAVVSAKATTNGEKVRPPLSTSTPFESFITKDPISLSEQILPEGVWHPRLVFGIVSEAAQLFDSRSRLTSVSRYNATLDSNYLKTMSPNMSELIENLNELYPGRLGDRLNLGSLEFHGGPEMSYFGLALAYGLTDRWTMGVALPFIHMYGGITIESSGKSNARDVERHVLNTEANNPHSNELIPNIRNLANNTTKGIFDQILEEKGFKSLEQIDYKGIGDLQILSVYNYFKKDPWNFYLMTTLNLPTGPKDDPDSLIDFPEFAQTKLFLKTHHEIQASNRLLFGSSLSYLWRISDRVVARIKEYKDDFIPGEDRKEFVYRNLGDEVSIEAFGKLQTTKFLSFDISISLSLATRDHYLGERPGSDYSLMEDDTDKYWVNGKLGMHFSTIDWFMKGRFPLPLIISYNHSDILYGRNKQREVRHEASLLLFF